MSYFAGRWARAHTLVLNRDSTALAVLKELADDYRDDLGRCRIDTYKELALCLGVKKPATVSEAVARLSALGLVRASNIIAGKCVVGTKFELVGYKKADWPETRQGKPVWVEVACACGIEPQPWWPQVDHIRKTDVLRKTDDPQKTEVVRKTDDPTPKNGIGVLRKTDDGYAEKRNTYTGNKQGLTGREQGVVPRPASRALESDTEATSTPVKKTRAKPRTLCPFVPEDACPQDWRDKYAPEFPSLSIAEEFRKFVGHYVAQGTTFANWKQAFGNWLDNAVKFKARDEARFASRPAPNYRNRPMQKEDMVYTDDF